MWLMVSAAAMISMEHVEFQMAARVKYYCLFLIILNVYIFGVSGSIV